MSSISRYGKNYPSIASSAGRRAGACLAASRWRQFGPPRHAHCHQRHLNLRLTPRLEVEQRQVLETKILNAKYSKHKSIEHQKLLLIIKLLG